MIPRNPREAVIVGSLVVRPLAQGPRTTISYNSLESLDRALRMNDFGERFEGYIEALQKALRGCRPVQNRIVYLLQPLGVGFDRRGLLPIAKVSLRSQADGEVVIVGELP